jgi:hypothetical protein
MAPAALKPPAPPVTPPSAPATPVRPVARPVEPEHGLDLSGIAPGPHLQAARLHGFVDRLRDLRRLHDRLRWAGGWLCWLAPVAVCVGLGVAAGAVTLSELDVSSSRENTALGRNIAIRHSTPEIPIEYSSSYYGQFQLRQSQQYMGVRQLVRPTSSTYTYTRRGDASFWTYDVRTVSDSKQLEAAEQYAADLNKALSQAAAEFNNTRSGRHSLTIAWAVGLPVGVGLLIAFTRLRRRKVRKLSEEVPALIVQTEAEYPRELRTLPEPLNLNSRGAIHNLVTGFERSGQAPGWMLPTPAHLFHRVLAPF